MGKSILEDKDWIYECSTLISDSHAKSKFIEDMEWFVGKQYDTYNDKKNGKGPGHYAGYDKTNERVLEKIRTYMNNRLKPRSEKAQWVAKIYANIPINKIIDYISKIYGV